MTDKPLAGAVRAATRIADRTVCRAENEEKFLNVVAQGIELIERDSGLLELVEAAASWMSIYRASMESRLKAIELHQLGVVPEAAARLEAAIENVRKP